MPHTRFSHLAIPNRFKVSKKYNPKPWSTQRTKHRKIMPIQDVRINFLAQPRKVHLYPDWVPRKGSAEVLRAAAKHGKCTARLKELSKTPIPKLQALLEYLKSHGKQLVEGVNKKIEESYNSIFNNCKQKKSLWKLEPKNKKIWGKGQMERTYEIARPRKDPPSPDEPERKKVPLSSLKKRIKELAEPSRFYKRPSQESFLNKLYKVSPSALKYEASDRIKNLCELPKSRLVELRPVKNEVKRRALLYEITDHIEQLAHPRPRAKAPEMDLKENAYEISKNALKYKATPRILNLAKPVDR